MARRILVVEDDPTVSAFIAETLRDEGFDVVTAADGQVALARAQEHPPDVILLDFQLPTLDGPQFAQAYRQLPAPHAPIILLTAAVSAQRRAAQVGANAFLGKPFELEALVRLVIQFAA